MITIQDIKDYLGIDYTDDMVDRNIERLIKVADSYLVGAIGLDYPKDDPRSKELALIIISDLYDNRGNTASDMSGNTRKLVHDLSWQLKLEMRGATNG